MTLVHILRGRNCILCTFIGGEGHRGDAYTKGEKTSFPYDCFVFDQVAHMFHIMFTSSHVYLLHYTYLFITCFTLRV